MGPIILFDKSFLQSLSLDESVWFDNFFYPVISPLFYVETLADLEKAVRLGRTPEKEVGIIAAKTPELHGGPCLHHSNLCLENLKGNKVPMNGRIPIAGGRLVKADGERGVVINTTPEAKAFARWQKGEFLEVERQFAQYWRASLKDLDLLAIAAGIRAMGIDSKTCKTLAEAKSMADKIVRATGRPSDVIKFASLFLGIPRELEDTILEKWKAAGSPPLTDYAPFAAHVINVDTFFQIALGAHLISDERSSNRVDIAYLFYLPFCMIFVSSDKLHRRCAPFFLRSDQEFVWGEELKKDLNKLNEHYLKLPESEKEKGIMEFASKPPETGDYLVSQLWDRHMHSWRRMSPHPKPKNLNKKVEKNIVERALKFHKAPTLSPEEIDFDPDNSDVLSIQRHVRKRKGSWWQMPKDLKVPDEN